MPVEKKYFWWSVSACASRYRSRFCCSAEILRGTFLLGKCQPRYVLEEAVFFFQTGWRGAVYTLGVFLYFFGGFL